MVKWRDLPPLSALRAFSAFADVGSVARAGADFGVSHAAISQQIRALEAHLGLALVSRTGKALVLTPEGQALARAALDGFSGMAEMVNSLTGAEAAREGYFVVTRPGVLRPSAKAFVAWVLRQSEAAPSQV